MKVYCAGNITMHDWRANLVAPATLDRSPAINWPIVSTIIPDVLYTGPFQHICGDECTGHVADHARLTQIQRFNAIYAADVVYLWNDLASANMFLEIGYAHALHKHIWIATPRSSDGLKLLSNIAERQQLGATDPIAALTHMISTPAEKRGFTWNTAASSLDQDLLGGKA